MKLNKEKFLKTELGEAIETCIGCWDAGIRYGDLKQATWCQAQWEAYKLAIKHFTEIEYAMSRDNHHYGLINEDDSSDWLFRVEREITD